MEVSVNIGDVAPGTMLSVDLGGDTVTIAAAEGGYYAFSDVCTHMGCSLAEGSITGKELICDCHGATFDLSSGEVLGGPARSALKIYPVSVSDGKITVSEA